MTMTTTSETQYIENLIIKQILVDAVKQGYYVSVFDGEGFAVHRSKDIEEITRNLKQADEESLCFYENEYYRGIGVVDLIYGNDGHDVISNHTDNPKMTKLLENATRLANLFESIQPKLALQVVLELARHNVIDLDPSNEVVRNEHKKQVNSCQLVEFLINLKFNVGEAQ